jgi:hypothetical protein
LSQNNQESGKISKLNLFVVLLGISAPAAYLLGLSYYQGTMEAYGISYATFPISTQEVYVYAFSSIGFLLIELTHLAIAAVKFVFSWQGFVWGLPISVFLVIFFYVIFKKPKAPKSLQDSKFITYIKQILSYLHWQNNNFTKAISTVGFLSYLILFVIYLLIAVALFWFALPLASYYKGFENSEVKRDKFLENGCIKQAKGIWSNCKLLKSKDGKVIHKGILISQLKDQVAFFSENGSIILTMPKGAMVVNEIYKQ